MTVVIDQFCACMMGPNYPDPKCDQCGGTGRYVSDERIAELRDSYAYLVGQRTNRFGLTDLEQSRLVADEQHLAILCELQSHRRAAKEKTQP